jgi:uncharacterized protein (DUF1499 family)
LIPVKKRSFLSRFLLRGVPLAAAVLLVTALGASWLISWRGRPPAGVGAATGRLADLPASPNAVASYAAGAYPRMEPLPFTGAADAARERLVALLAGQPRSRIETAADNYVHATFRSRLFRFVDDVEFLIDPDGGVIHYRAAARMGYSDMGVNQARMEAIRQAWLQE